MPNVLKNPPDGLFVTNDFVPKHISANASSSNIKTGPGLLRSVTINTKGASSNVLTLYDDVGTGTGNVIAVIDTTANVGFLLFDAQFQNGLNYALATGTAADVTITYR
jgi:hypothetical protein